MMWILILSTLSMAVARTSLMSLCISPLEHAFETASGRAAALASSWMDPSRVRSAANLLVTERMQMKPCAGD
ncbi:hypothetical protein EUGRSUZ_C00693 [Eucalyptus grandis]|uniref:Uncharacterized protein n=2 Tax=Eucalyptus grandis TaxID=71139 RepID=A0ACC3LCP3_EUCGR|nr:hypothetical protein EUGRSUZ_C00693 [Eucalyptus grandis]